jgi:hypothetical protein
MLMSMTKGDGLKIGSSTFEDMNFGVHDISWGWTNRRNSTLKTKSKNKKKGSPLKKKILKPEPHKTLFLSARTIALHWRAASAVKICSYLVHVKLDFPVNSGNKEKG